MSKSNNTTKILLVTGVSPVEFRKHSTDRETGRFVAGGKVWSYAGELCRGPQLGHIVTARKNKYGVWEIKTPAGCVAVAD